MIGRIEQYTYSDAIRHIQNKGIAVVRVECDTNFSARTNVFKLFAAKIAEYAYGAMARDWEDIKEVWPEAEIERKELEQKLRESVRITGVQILCL